MSRSTWTEEERQLAEVLDEESRTAVPRPDGWAAIASRVAGDDLTARREQRRHRTRGALAGLLATGLVAATVVFAIGGGLHRDPTPTTPTQSPTSTAGFDPSSPRTTWTIYRAGTDQLYADEVRATAPYDPAQAFAALFSQASPTAGPLGLEANGRNRVASLRTTATAIVLDLDAADTTADRRPGELGGTGRLKAAGLEAQGWVATAHAAFNGSDLPLLVTLRGQPFQLFGVFDTSAPIKARTDVPTLHTQRVFLPEAGASVTSPVAIVGNPGAGDYVWTVRSAATGEQVWSDEAQQQDDEGTLGFSADLPPGAYELVVKPGPDRPKGSSRNLFQSSFTVSGPAPASTRTPVTNPATTDVPRVGLTWPERDRARLIEQWRPLGSVEQAVADLAEGPVDSGTAVVRPWQGTAVALVSTRSDRVVIDLTAAPDLRAPDLATASLWTSTLTRAVDEVLVSDLPVQITVAGRPVTLFGRLDTSEPVAGASLVPVSEPGLFSPRDGHWGTGEAVVVGAGAAGNTAVTWYVVDPVSNETLYQGRVALDTQDTYGFRLPLPAGDYLLTLHLDDGQESTTVYDLTVL